MSTVFIHHLAVSLRWFTDNWAPADSHAWPRIFEQEVDSRQPTDGRGCREKWRGDRLEMYDHGRLPTLTDADSRCVAFAPSACDRVKPYPSVTGPWWARVESDISRDLTSTHVGLSSKWWRFIRRFPWVSVHKCRDTVGSVHVCSRTIGGVRTPRAVYVRHLRCVYTHPCSYTIQTLTDDL